MTQAETRTRPAVGDELELVDRVARLRRPRASRRADGYVAVRAGRDPGRPRARARRQAQAQLRRGARVRAARAGARPDRAAGAASRARRGRCCRTSASSRRSRRRCVDALERIGGFERPPVEPIVPAVEQWHYRNKLEYSFGEGADGRARARLPPAGQLARRSIDVAEDVLASAAVDELRAPRQGLVRERGAVRVRPRDARGLPAQPRRARGPAHRRSSRPGSSRAPATSARRIRRGGRRGQRRSGAGPPSLAEVTRDGETAGAVRARTRSRSGSARCASGSRPTPSSRRTPRWPSASTRSRRSSPA